MKKLLQLIFGDWRNTAAVAASVAVAMLLARETPSLGGAGMVAALLLATWWQASR